MRLSRCLIVVTLLTAAAGRSLRAQQDVVVAGEVEGYLRLLEIDGLAHGLPLVYRSLSSLRTARVTGSHPWVGRGVITERPDSSTTWWRLVPLEFRTVYNSRYPRGINDGALWAGRGFSVAASGGVAGTIGPLSAWLYPTAMLEQNRDFDIWPVTSTTYSPLSYPWRVGRIDWPQRMGTTGRARLDPGQSGIRLDHRALTLGLSTENLVWGPAVMNPIVMSASAAGFPHVDLGLGRPVATPLGRLESRLVWGRLTESNWFDTVATNNARIFTGLTLAWEPRWLPGLTLGMTRVLYTMWDDSLRFVDFVDVFQPFLKQHIATSTDPEGNDDRDQLLSLVARWTFPASGFEAYVEWARNDHSVNLRDFLLQPDHSQTWSAGFQKSLPSGPLGRIRLRGEVNHLSRSHTFQVRATPSLYQHHLVRQGYTHQGQLIGAGIGPGSDSQHLGIDRFTPGGRWGFFFQRVRYDDDAYYQLLGPIRRREGHNVELTGGVSVLRWLGDFRAALQLSLSRELNRHYVMRRDATNLNAVLTVGWNPATGQARD